MSGFYIPNIYERQGGVERAYDVYSRLLIDRIVFLHGEINDASADAIVAQLLFLNSQNPQKDINLYINSPGGSVTAGLAIYDTIKYIKPEVQTYCLGQAASMAAVILCAGEKGKRYALPSSRAMIHQPWGGTQGQSTDLSIQAKEIVRLKKLLIEYVADNTGRSFKQIEKDMERDFFMTAEEAVKYGLVDNIMKRESNAKT